MNVPLNLRVPEELKKALQDKADKDYRTLSDVSTIALAKSVNFDLKNKKTAQQK